ncbi:hypothetical protein AAY473_016916 [Plecturocebus cupreus]
MLIITETRFHQVGQTGLEFLTSGGSRSQEINLVKPGDHPGQPGETPSTKNRKISWAWWHAPVVPATWEAEAGESLEPGAVGYACSPSTFRGQGGRITSGQEFESSLDNIEFKTSMANMVKPVSTKNTKLGWARWRVPIIPATQEAEAGESLEPRRRKLQKFQIGQVQQLTPVIPALWEAKAGRSPELFGRPQQADHLSSGVPDQPGQYGETPSLLKIKKLAWHGGGQCGQITCDKFDTSMTNMQPSNKRKGKTKGNDHLNAENPVSFNRQEEKTIQDPSNTQWTGSGTERSRGCSVKQG